MGDDSFVVVSHASVLVGKKQSALGKLVGVVQPQHVVLSDISFSLSAGSQVTLFGGVGAGKSTLLRLLTGALAPDTGMVLVNGSDPRKTSNLASGYISSEESEPEQQTAYQVLQGFGASRSLQNLPARIGDIAEQAGIGAVLHRPAQGLSTAERLRLNIARAILADAPLLLLDDVADQLSPAEVLDLLNGPLVGRTALVATRQVRVAEELELPILLLHKTALVQHGTRDEIASATTVERVLDIWVEGLRYDLLRTLKKHPGVASVRLLSTTDFNGQKLRIVLKSSRYLPSLYDVVSQAPLVKVEEIPPSLQDIIANL